MNGLDLAVAALAAIKNNPQHWEQSQWRCKSGMCFAGWAVTLADPTAWANNELADLEAAQSLPLGIPYETSADWQKHYAAVQEAMDHNITLKPDRTQTVWEGVDDYALELLKLEWSDWVPYEDDEGREHTRELFDERNDYEDLMNGVCAAFQITYEELTQKVDDFTADWQFYLKHAGLAGE